VLLAAISAPFLPLKFPEPGTAAGRLLPVMERLHLLDMVARIRLVADDCERLILAQKEKVKALRVLGKPDGEEETRLSQLESEYDKHMAEMERLLNELDQIA
jgi:hypothetical protein